MSFLPARMRDESGLPALGAERSEGRMRAGGCP
ncbi:MAG: hypothetical protein QOI63_1968 [Thermoplasmata archaeon]|nr:hypothetical protein [Thermoplasmata archaeon]